MKRTASAVLCCFGLALVVGCSGNAGPTPLATAATGSVKPPSAAPGKDKSKTLNQMDK